MAQRATILNGRQMDRKERLRLEAVEFIERHYRDALNGAFDLDAQVLRDMCELLGLNQSQFALILGIDKGSLSNVINRRRRMMRSTQLLMLERLAMELARPGSALCLIQGGRPEICREDMRLLIENIRFNLRFDKKAES